MLLIFAFSLLSLNSHPISHKRCVKRYNININININRKIKVKATAKVKEFKSNSASKQPPTKTGKKTPVLTPPPKSKG